MSGTGARQFVNLYSIYYKVLALVSDVETFSQLDESKGEYLGGRKYRNPQFEAARGSG